MLITIEKGISKIIIDTEKITGEITPEHQQFIDYAEWLHEEGARQFMKKLEAGEIDIALKETKTYDIYKSDKS